MAGEDRIQMQRARCRVHSGGKMPDAMGKLRLDMRVASTPSNKI